MSRIRRSKGFTLAELMLTTAIIIILAGLGFIALINYQKNLKLTEMDNAAREIFVAAQNHLTASEKSGEWDEFYTSALSSDNYDVKMDSDDSHDYYYVIYNPNETDALKTSSLQYILPFGSIDDTLRSSGSYIIEYDAKNASVRSVFFTDGGKSSNEYFRLNSSISWSQANALRPTKRDQKKQERREYKSGNTTAAIGYYGEASVTKNEVILKEPTVVVHNDNTLSADIYDPNYGLKDNNGNELVTKLQLVVTGMDSKATAGITLSYNKTGNALSSTTENVKIPGKSAYYLEINKDILKGAKAEMAEDPDTHEKALKYTITLDQIDDSSKANLHFAHLFPCSNNEGERGTEGRYFTAGEDINIRAQIVLDTRASGQSRLSAASVSSSKTTNSLFASSEQSDFTYRTVKDKRKANDSEHKVIINNLRHLQNLDPDVSDLEQGGTEYFRVIQAEVVSSLDWNAYFNDRTITDYKTGNSLTDQGKFYPVDNKRISLLEGKDGQNITIHNLNIGTRERTGTGGNRSVYSGLFARLDNPDDFELTVRNLSLSDLNIDDKNDDSDAYLGGIIGYANANVYIENVHVYDTNRNTYKNHAITGGTNAEAGGLVGQSGDTDNKGSLSIRGSSVTIHVESGQDAGGLIGAGRGIVTIDNSYAGGYVDENGTYSQDTANILSTGAEGSHAGGFIASIQRGSLTIEDSFATTSVSGRTVGGLIGTSENEGTNISLKNVYYAGAVYSDGTRNEASVGGIIGHQEKTRITTDGYINTLLGETMIYGSSEADASHITTIDKETSTASNGLANLTDHHALETHPYSQSLQGQDYPYSMNQDKYYGDWIYLDDHARFVITKTIHLDKDSIPQDQIQTELEFIKNNTGFDVDRFPFNDDSRYSHYTELYLKDASCTPGNDGYTQACTLNADLETGYYYQFTEVNNGINNSIWNDHGRNDTVPHSYYYGNYDRMNQFPYNQSIKDHFVSQSDDSYLNTNYEVTVHGDSETYQRNNVYDEYRKTGEEKNLTRSIDKANDTQTIFFVSTADTAIETLNDNSYIQFTNPVFDISFDNTYAKNKPVTVNGLIYYEGLSSSSKGDAQRYTFHSVENTVDENGVESVKESNNLETGTGRYAVDDGYLITLDDDKQSIRFNKYNGEGTYHSVNDWINMGVLTEVSNSKAEKYGIDSSKKIYRINLEALKSNVIGGDGDYPGMIIMRITAGNKEYIYSLNEVFGDCVSAGDNQKQNSFEIRSADQLERFTTWKDSRNEAYSTSLFGQGSYTVHQMLDIDMSGRSFHTIERMQNSTYEGPEDGSLVKLLNLNNTFTKSVEVGSNINNLIFSFNIQADEDQLPSVNNSYGLITAYMQESHINNVSVQDTVIGEGTIGTANNKADSFGIIGKDSWGSSITNVTFKNIVFNGSSVYASNVGLIGNTNGTAVDNLNTENVSYQNCTIQADNFGGIIGCQNQGSITGITSNELTISNVDITGTDIGGISGYQEQGSVNGVSSHGMTIDNMTFNGQNAGGIIGYVHQANISDITSDGLSVQNSGITGTNAGGVIGSVSAGTVSDITLSDTSMTDNAMTVTNFGGAAGTQDGTISNTTVHDLSMKDDSDGNKSINAQYFGGVFGNIQGTVNGITVSASDSADIDSHGISMQGLKINSQMFGGVIGYNKASVHGVTVNNQTVDSQFSDIQITDNDFSGSLMQYPDQNMYDYGAVIGNNEGTLENFSMSNVSMRDNTFPSGDNVNIGLLAGINQLNINNSVNQDTHSIHDLTIKNCYVPSGSNKALIHSYAFIGKNSSLGNQYYNRAVINNVVIRDYVSDGHGYVYQNVKDGLIQNCSILPTSTDDYEPVTKDNQTVDYDVNTSIYDWSVMNDSSAVQIVNSNIFATTVSP